MRSWGFDMPQVFNALFTRYGTELTIGENTVRGFFFSINSQSWQNMDQVYSALGEIPRGQYICVLPADVAVAAGNTVQVGQKTYQFRRVEDMRFRDDTIYRWCLCVERGGDDPW